MTAGARRGRSTVEPGLEFGHERGGAIGAADETADDEDHLQDLGDAALVEQHHRVAALSKVGGDVALQVREREDQVGASASIFS